jgi:hypothetical protein
MHPGEHDHGHDGGEHHDLPHDPAPPERRQIIPVGPMLARGGALLGLAAALGWLAVTAFQKGGLWLAPLTAVLGVAGLLSAWAAAIHLTGGEKFDDHPFV